MIIFNGPGEAAGLCTFTKILNKIGKASAVIFAVISAIIFAVISAVISAIISVIVSAVIRDNSISAIKDNAFNSKFSKRKLKGF